MRENGDPDSQACNPFLTLWSEFASMMLRAATASPMMTPPEAVRKVRGSTFEALSKYFDEYLRSPQFLHSMKQSLDAAINMRTQMNESLTNLHHAVHQPAREDVDQLMLMMRHLETRLLHRIDKLEARIDGGANRRSASGRKTTRSQKPRTRRAARPPKNRPKT